MVLRLLANYSLSSRVKISVDRILLIFVLLIPIINALADVTVYYFTTEEARGMHPGIVRGILLIIFIFYFFINRFFLNRTIKSILLFLTYLFILVLFSSNVEYSFLNGYIKWAVPLMMFPVGYYFFRNLNLLKKLNLSYILAAAIICINFVVAQIYGIGISSYLQDSFYLGGAGVGIANSLSIILLTSPLLLAKYFHNSKKVLIFYFFILSISSFFILISMKRAAIFGLTIGFVVYAYYSYRKIKIFKYVLVTALFFLITLPYYEYLLISRIEARTTERNKLENESRYKEIIFVWEEFKTNSVKHALFGSELFNSRQYFGPKYFSSDRMIHGDIASFFYGSGLIGIIFYLNIFYNLFQENYRIRRKIKSKSLLIEMNAVFFGILSATFLISITGSGSIGERSLVYLYLGAIMGCQKSFLKSIFSTYKIKNNQIKSDTV
jgi:hypothetical protein